MATSSCRCGRAPCGWTMRGASDLPALRSSGCRFRSRLKRRVPARCSSWRCLSNSDEAPAQTTPIGAQSSRSAFPRRRDFAWRLGDRTAVPRFSVAGRGLSNHAETPCNRGASTREPYKSEVRKFPSFLVDRGGARGWRSRPAPALRPPDASGLLRSESCHPRTWPKRRGRNHGMSKAPRESQGALLFPAAVAVAEPRRP